MIRGVVEWVESDYIINVNTRRRDAFELVDC